MKNLLYLLLFTLTFSACKKDKNDLELSQVVHGEYFGDYYVHNGTRYEFTTTNYAIVYISRMSPESVEYKLVTETGQATLYDVQVKMESGEVLLTYKQYLIGRYRNGVLTVYEPDNHNFYIVATRKQ